MDYEKAYKEVLERAKSFQEKYGGDYAGYIFPELRESEDERIRKRLLWFLANYTGRWDYPETRMACRAWLEKQKEQKPAEWSEEDEKIITRLIGYFDSFRIAGVATKWEGLDIQEVITLLKSLRSPKSSDNWKPSEDQMEKEEDGWYSLREATKRLNAMGLGISFFGNLFQYLRKRGKLDGLCKLGRIGAQRVWLYDVMGIAEKVKKGELKYKQRWIKN